MDQALLMKTDQHFLKTEYKVETVDMANISTVLNITRTGEVPQWLYTLLGVCLSVFGFVGIFANGISLLVLLKTRTLRTSTNMFIICLLINDLVMCFICIPLTAVANFYGSFVHGFGACVFQGFLMFFGSISSLFMFGAISLYRYFVITNTAASFDPSFRTAKITICSCYCLGLFWSAAPFTGWTSYEYEAIGTTCAVRLNTVDSWALSYNICLFIFCYLLPIAMMIISYSLIYRKMKSVSRTPAVTRQSKALRSRMKLERRLIRTVVIMVAAFLLSWSPYAAVAFWRAFGLGDLPAVVSGIPALLAKSSVLWDPFIYAFTNTQFREALSDFMPCRKIRRGKFSTVDDDVPGKSTNDDEKTKVLLVSVSPI